MNTNNPTYLVEDLFLVAQLSDAIANGAAAESSAKRANLLERCAKRIADQQQEIRSLRTALDISKQQHAEAVAIANATNETLKEAVAKLQETSSSPSSTAKLYFRKIRTEKYDQQVNRLLHTGHLTDDPRKTSAMPSWYMNDNHENTNDPE